MTYKKTVRVERDLRDIYRYTRRQFGRPQALKYLNELESVFGLISEQPRIARVYKGQIRQFVHNRHIVLYCIETDSVLIVQILHGAQRQS